MPIVVPTPNTVITSAWGKSVADALNASYPAELAHAQFTGLVAVTATTGPTANTVVTAPATAFDGTTVVMVEFYAPRVTPNTAVAAQLYLTLWDGATDTGILATVTTPAAAEMRVPVLARVRLTPTAATHTYSVRAWTPAATGTVQAGPGGAGAFHPGYLRIQRAM